MSEFDREPCFWTNASPTYNLRDRQRTFMKDGKPVTEKFPARGHGGDYEDRRRVPGTRFIRVIDHFGHEVFLTLTNAAAHLDHTAPFGQHMMGKARHFGWFMPGACPCALLATKELSPNHIVAREILTQQPCSADSYSYDKRCPHSLAEQAARRAQNDAVQEAREISMKGDATKNLEATEKMGAAVAEAVQKLVELQAAQLDKKGKTEK